MITQLFASRWPEGCAVALLFLAQLQPAPGQSAAPASWQAQSIYQVITDRFYDGDPANNNADGNYRPAGRTSVHGGDFKGLEQKLDYIQALGATALWISPVVLNGRGQFHGYAGRDFYRVDPHWGSLADLQHLVRSAHARGLRVIDDIVCNHGDNLISSADPGYGQFIAPPAGYHLAYTSQALTYAPPFDIYNSTYNYTNNQLALLFHNQGGIADFHNLQEEQLGELSGLDDFRTESPYVRSNLAAIYGYWIQAAGFDGFRIDTVKHVENEFWQDWCPRVRQIAAAAGRPDFFMFGEVEDADEALCGSFTGTRSGGPYELDSVLDYPLYFLTHRVFTGRGAPALIDRHYENVARDYDPTAQMRLVTFLDNHDQPRFLHSGNPRQLAMALAFLYTTRGIPCLYYGTEQAFSGATDPFDREDMFAGQFKDPGQAGTDSFNMTHPLFQLVAKLNNFRRLYPALSLGKQVSLWHDDTGPGLYACSRRLGTQEVVTVFNTAAATKTLPRIELASAPGTTWVNLLAPDETLTLGAASRTPEISVPPETAKIFLPRPQLLPLDPTVITNYPSHSATNISLTASIILQFSQPMNTNTVQAAFRIMPAVAGAFAWSPARDTLTFMPAAGGLQESTNIIVRLERTATAMPGTSLHAPYELEFATSRQ